MIIAADMSRRTAVLALAWIAGAAGMAFMAAFAAAHDRFPGDLWLTHRIQEIDGAAFSRLLDWAEDFADFPLLVIIWIATAAVLLFVSRPWAAALMIVSLAGRLPNTALKEIVQRPRPSGDLVEVDCEPSSFSFPSGHSEGAVIVFGLIFYFAWRYAPNVWLRVPVQVASVAVVFLTGVERVYVGCHWPSDVLGGLLFGALVLTVIIVTERLVISRAKE